MAATFIGEYQVVRELGRSIYSTVYLVESKQSRRYALKVLRLSNNESYVKKLRREAKIQQRMFHPCIVKAEDYLVINNEHCILMEYAEGEDLGKILERRGQLPLKEILHISLQICEALDYIHSQGVVHRDLKPQNIIVNARGDIKITDLGLASITSSSISSMSFSIVGTPYYISPEQAQGDKGDARSDLYSLGVILYQMLTGRPPFHADNPLVILNLHQTAKPQKIAELRKDVPQDLEFLTQKALLKSPNARFQTAAALREAVQQVAEKYNVAIDKKQNPFPSATMTLTIVIFILAVIWFVVEKSFEPLSVLLASMAPLAALLVRSRGLQAARNIDRTIATLIGVIFVLGTVVIVAPRLPGLFANGAAAPPAAQTPLPISSPTQAPMAETPSTPATSADSPAQPDSPSQAQVLFAQAAAFLSFQNYGWHAIASVWFLGLLLLSYRTRRPFDTLIIIFLIASVQLFIWRGLPLGGDLVNLLFPVLALFAFFTWLILYIREHSLNFG